MDAVDWVGAVAAAVVGAGGVMYFTWNEFHSDDEDNGTDSRTDERGD